MAPIVGKTDSFIKNSVHLVERLSGVKLEQDECILSYDVSALFTSVPVEESLNIILEKLTADTTLSERTVFTAQQVVDLLRIVLTTTYFKYNGDFYIQVDRAAMGSPVSPIVANIFMEWFEQRALTTFQAPLASGDITLTMRSPL